MSLMLYFTYLQWGKCKTSATGTFFNMYYSSCRGRVSSVLKPHLPFLAMALNRSTHISHPLLFNPAAISKPKRAPSCLSLRAMK